MKSSILVVFIMCLSCDKAAYSDNVSTQSGNVINVINSFNTSTVDNCCGNKVVAVKDTAKAKVVRKYLKSRAKIKKDCGCSDTAAVKSSVKSDTVVQTKNSVNDTLEKSDSLQVNQSFAFAYFSPYTRNEPLSSLPVFNENVQSSYSSSSSESSVGGGGVLLALILGVGLIDLGFNVYDIVHNESTDKYFVYTSHDTTIINNVIEDDTSTSKVVNNTNNYYYNEIDNSVTDNSVTDNSVIDNSVIDNHVIDNSITDNSSIINNVVTDNSVVNTSHVEIDTRINNCNNCSNVPEPHVYALFIFCAIFIIIAYTFKISRKIS